jgi:hypothetical protein
MIPALLALGAWLAIPAGSAPSAAAVPQEESLRYNVNWPSGLSLGEAEIRAGKTKVEAAPGFQWEFSLRLEAAVPSFSVVDSHRSVATAELCVVELEKQAQRGKRNTKERTTFDATSGMATRETLEGGGKSEFSIPACARDALAFLYYVRRELSQGRIPPSQTIFFGAPYDVRLEYGGRQTLVAGGQRTEVDRIQVTAKGKVSDTVFEVFFALDPTRTPVLVRLPLAMGTFSMELAR